MTIPGDPTPIEPEPEPIPDDPGGPGPSDRSESEIDADLEATFPSSDLNVGPSDMKKGTIALP